MDSEPHTYYIYYITELVAEPTTISPVVDAPPSGSTLCRYTWIMFTVSPLLVTPSPVGLCSFVGLELDAPVWA